jgi:hypothetical protein
MDLRVDLVTGHVVLDGWETMTSLSVQVDGGSGDEPDPDADGRLDSILARSGAGRATSDGDALLPAAVVRDLAVTAAEAAGRSRDGSWDEGFAGMLEFAGTKGWIDDDGAIRAHVEWRNS